MVPNEINVMCSINTDVGNIFPFIAGGSIREPNPYVNISPALKYFLGTGICPAEMQCN